ncbi:MAG: Gfo/Idh/MocA family oxidoreductase [Micromonosporaceae bacterium]
MNEVGWAFVGTSGWVDSRFAPSVQRAGHRIVGAFGSSPEGSARFAERYGCKAYGSLAELLADDAVEAVWVASPTAYHPEHALAAAEAGRAVLVEKPVAADAASAHRMAEQLARYDVLIGTAFQHRFNPGVAAVARALAHGRIGTMCSLTIHRAVSGPPRPTSWRMDPRLSGGWSISDLGTHLIDMARHLTGEVDFLAARLSSPGRGLALDDLSVVVLTHGEATITVRAAMGMVGPGSYIEVSGTEGWLRLSDFWTGGGRLLDHTGTEVEIPATDPYVAQVRAFSAAVRGAAWVGATLADGVRVAELTEAARSFRACPAG